MAIKIINSALMLFAAFMGIKHGWAGVSGKPEVVDMFAKWNIGKLWGVGNQFHYTARCCSHAHS